MIDKDLIQQLADEKIAEGNCAKVRLHHFGVFKVKPKRLYIINKDTENE